MAVLEEPIKEPMVLKNFLGGKWIESKGELQDVVNPATCKTIARVPFSTNEEVKKAVEVAKQAFPEWRRTTPLASPTSAS